MKPLVTLQRCLFWLCIHPAEETASVKQKKVYVKFTVAALAGQILQIVACVAFCWKFFSIDLERCMFAGIAVVALFGSAYMLVIAVILMQQKVVAVFKDLTTIYDTSK